MCSHIGTLAYAKGSEISNAPESSFSVGLHDNNEYEEMDSNGKWDLYSYTLSYLHYIITSDTQRNNILKIKHIIIASSS